MRTKVTKCIREKIRCTFMSESLNHIDQDTKSAPLIAVCKRSLRWDEYMCRKESDDSSNENVNAFHLNDKVYAFVCFLNDGLGVFIPTEVVTNP